MRERETSESNSKGKNKEDNYANSCGFENKGSDNEGSESGLENNEEDEEGESKERTPVKILSPPPPAQPLQIETISVPILNR